MERIAQPVPKSCYAVEFDLSSQVCQECEFQQACFEALGVRKRKVTLDKLEFKLVPKEYGLEDIQMDDPELPTLERTYIVCHQTIFGRRPKDKIGQHKTLLLRNVEAAGVSIRLFMLANMVGYRQQQKQIAEHSDRGEKRYYSAVQFTYANAVSRVQMFREMCRKEFGTFSLSSLDTLTESHYSENDMEQRMMHSEVTAAKFVIGYKFRHSGPPWEPLYAGQELALDPYWLATEQVYYDTIIARHLAGERSTKMINGHRYSVTQVRAQMKKKRDWAIAIFQAREKIMPAAVSRVLHAYGFVPKDFEMDQEPIRVASDFWNFLGRAIQHVECIRYIDEGESAISR